MLDDCPLECVVCLCFISALTDIIKRVPSTPLRVRGRFTCSYSAHLFVLFYLAPPPNLVCITVREPDVRRLSARVFLGINYIAALTDKILSFFNRNLIKSGFSHPKIFTFFEVVQVGSLFWWKNLFEVHQNA